MSILGWKNGFPMEGTRCKGKLKSVGAQFECTVNSYKNGKVWFTEHTQDAQIDFVYPLEEIEFSSSQHVKYSFCASLVNDFAPEGTYKEKSLMAEFARRLYDVGLFVDPGYVPMTRKQADNALIEVFSGWTHTPMCSRAQILDALGFKE